MNGRAILLGGAVLAAVVFLWRRQSANAQAVSTPTGTSGQQGGGGGGGYSGGGSQGDQTTSVVWTPPPTDTQPPPPTDHQAVGGRPRPPVVPGHFSK